MEEVFSLSICYSHKLGNPLNWIWGDTLTWQNGRQLASVGGVTYGYNADGLRVSKTWARGSTEYYVVDGQYIGEKTVNNGTQYYIYYIYDEKGSPAGITVNGTQYWFVKNLQGDVTAILDSSGAVVANYRYDAYGYIISITNGSGANVGLTDTGHIARLNPFRYRGYMYDEETEFYYLRSRYYDPFIGRFLNADGLISTGIGLMGYNMFAYCNDSPVFNRDDSGMSMVLDNRGIVAGPCSASISIGGIGLLSLLSLLFTSAANDTAVPAVDTSPTVPALSIPSDKDDDTVAEKEKVIADSSRKGGTTYYHSTTLESALAISSSGKMYGSKLEGGYVFAWRMKPNSYAVKNSGAHTGVIISFKTNASFCDDNGIKDPKVLMFKPVVSVRKGPIRVWDVEIVG